MPKIGPDGSLPHITSSMKGIPACVKIVKVPDDQVKEDEPIFKLVWIGPVESDVESEKSEEEVWSEDDVTSQVSNVQVPVENRNPSGFNKSDQRCDSFLEQSQNAESGAKDFRSNYYHEQVSRKRNNSNNYRSRKNYGDKRKFNNGMNHRYSGTNLLNGEEVNYRPNNRSFDSRGKFGRNICKPIANKADDIDPWMHFNVTQFPDIQFKPFQYGAIQHHVPILEHHGPILEHHGLPLEHHGPPQERHGLPLEHHGPPLELHGPPQEHHGLPLERHGPPLEHHGLPLEHHGLPLGHHGLPLEQHGPPQEQHGSAREHPRPVREQEAEHCVPPVTVQGRLPPSLEYSGRVRKQHGEHYVSPRPSQGHHGPSQKYPGSAREHFRPTREHHGQSPPNPSAENTKARGLLGNSPFSPPHPNFPPNSQSDSFRYGENYFDNSNEYLDYHPNDYPRPICRRPLPSNPKSYYPRKDQHLKKNNTQWQNKNQRLSNSWNKKNKGRRRKAQLYNRAMADIEEGKGINSVSKQYKIPRQILSKLKKAWVNL